MKEIIYITSMVLLLNGCVNCPPKNTAAEPDVRPDMVPVIEQTTDLGFGFKRVILAETSHSTFESIGHFEYLYYHEQRLCKVDACSVSPTGNYVIYQDGPSGNVFLFRSSDRKITQLTPKHFAYVDSFEWHEEARTVDVHFAKRRTVKTYPLQ